MKKKLKNGETTDTYSIRSRTVWMFQNSKATFRGFSVFPENFRK